MELHLIYPTVWRAQIKLHTDMAVLESSYPENGIAHVWSCIAHEWSDIY